MHVSGVTRSYSSGKWPLPPFFLRSPSIRRVSLEMEPLAARIRVRNSSNISLKQRLKICVATCNRADYSKLEPIITAVQADPDLSLSLIVLGTHLIDDYG